MPVPEYYLRMDPADLKWFASHLGTPRCFPGSLRVGVEHWPIWIGYRGRYSRRFPKPSYDLWFPPEAPFAGRRQLHLNAAYTDPSLLRARLSLSLFADLEVPVPAAWHARVSLNGREQGLYTVIESLDGTWLRRHGLPGGSIYYGVGGEGHFGLINPLTGRPKRYVTLGYEKCHPPDDDFSDLEQLIYQVALPAQEDFAAGIEQWVDVEEVLRWLVGVVYVSHIDGLTHNYAVFRGWDGCWVISPWDLDGTWGRVPSGMRRPADHMPLHGGGGNYLVARLLALPRWRRRYREIWDWALAGPLAPERVIDRLYALFAEVQPAALADPRKPYQNSTFLRERPRMRSYVAERTAFLRRELARGSYAATPPPR